MTAAAVTAEAVTAAAMMTAAAAMTAAGVNMDFFDVAADKVILFSLELHGLSVDIGCG
jgi:hypothetical protein